MPRLIPSQLVTIIDKMFPGQEQKTRPFTIGIDRVNQLAAIVEMADKIPDELITIEGEDYGNFLLSLAAIRSAVSTWQSYGHGPDLHSISGLPNLNPVIVFRNCLSLCPDDFPTKGTTELMFITDPQFREILRIDISSANKAFINGEWKAATVLAGSIAEALLLWILQPIADKNPEIIEESLVRLLKEGKIKRKPRGKPEDWNLHPLIEVSRNLDLIKENTSIQARLAKDFRNLIHPGVSVRKNQACSRATALSALAALELILENISFEDKKLEVV
ncbi:MAG: hypothetical protein HY879_09090, partial [Deltaproteobacteria bacterium]|nr:hypothetical protein [Deltaproteobacteria bacterium]